MSLNAGHLNTWDDEDAMSKFSVGIIALLAGMVAAAPSFAQGTASMGDKESPMQRSHRRHAMSIA